MTKEDKKRVGLIAMLFVIFVLLCYGLVLLLNMVFVENGGEEIGQYCNVDNASDVLTIDQYMTFSLVISGHSISGTYQTYECCDADCYVILYADSGDHIVSSYSYDGTIIMIYNSELIYFERAE